MTAVPSRRVLVTGGASGLGAALVSAFEARGDDVLVCDVNEPSGGFEPFETVAAQPPQEPTVAEQPPQPPSYLRLDVRSDDDWATALAWVEEHWGSLDLLVNNAGVAGGGRVDVATMDEWRWITEINLFGVVRGTRTFVPMFKAQRSGRIVNVASLAGLVHPAGMGSYNAVKAGVVAFTETIGHELASYGVHAHVVCPSYFRTNLMSSARGADTALVGVVARLVESSPVTADEIAAAVLAGIERGDEVILPDDAARQAWGLKQHDRASYDAIMRDQAAKLDQVGQK